MTPAGPPAASYPEGNFGAELDLAAARAWPAREVAVLDGWWFRANDGLHRRVNSVFPETIGRRPLADHIAEAEAFYRERNLPPRFQITPATEPADLDAILAARGYVTESGVDIMITDAAPLAAAMPVAAPAIRLDAEISDAWLDVHMADAEDDAAKRRKGAMLGRIEPAHVFASLSEDGETLAAGLAIADEKWFGVFGMFTLERARRRGYARILLSAMADWALAIGCTRAYLQVERDNPAAIAVYGRAGFRTVHGYHYRTLWDNPNA
jgi:GNAT superfamily N-acetyltransferase